MSLSRQEKVDTLRELTRGPDDVFSVRSLGRTEEKDRWRPIYAPLKDHNLISHLAGTVEVGSYPLIPTDSWPRCFWILADFDGKRPGTNWKADVKRATEFLLDFDGCPAFVNLSRSGNGAHIRMLFKESVPAWLARRWFSSWLKEAEVLVEHSEWEEVPPSFDRLIPPQDTLSGEYNDNGYRMPGNLAGSPLHGGHARANGGTLPLDPLRVVEGDFEPDGKHWEHTLAALEHRAWGETELLAALEDCPEHISPRAPEHIAPQTGAMIAIPPGTDRQLEYTLKFCAFMRHMMSPGTQGYGLWVALATQLHRFGEDGRVAFHDISAADPRYDSKLVDIKWKQTARMKPIRCDTLVASGFRCPHLSTKRCNGAKAPTYFAEHTDAEIL